MEKKKKKKSTPFFFPSNIFYLRFPECAIDDVREKKKETNVESTHDVAY
jgi:hypothetical protein